MFAAVKCPVSEKTMTGYGTVHSVWMPPKMQSNTKCDYRMTSQANNVKTT